MTLATGTPAVDLSVVAADALTPAQRQEIIGLCTAAFDEDFSALFNLMPHSTHVIARLSGVLVGHACWVTRWLEPEGSGLLCTAYIEAVATAPDHQGQGLGTTVMQRVAVETAGYDLAALSTGSPWFYERLGWQQWPGPTAIRTANGLIDTTGENVMILRTPQTPLLAMETRLTGQNTLVGKDQGCC